jgi:hypothetical protein
MDEAEYQREYDKAIADLDAAEKSTTARGPDGKFAKAAPAEEKPAEKAPEPEKSEPEPTPKEEPTQDEAKDETPKESDELAELRKRFEANEKALKDTQAWATKLSQERAAEKREAERRAREASKPSILDANPELADAIRHVVSDQPRQEEQVDPRAQWQAVIEKAHPGIFSTSIDKELEKDLGERLAAMPDESKADPLEVIREITEGKLAFATRKFERQAAAEAKQAKEKAAMSVPGAGAGGSRTVADPGQADVQRVQTMSEADFEREYRKARGY